MVTKFGIACSLATVYLVHPILFPVGCAAATFGFCNFFARAFTALSPILAKIEEPLPIMLFTVITIVAAIMALGIQIGDTNEKK